MAEQETFRGIVSAVSRAEDQGRITITFWLKPVTGKGVPVKLFWDEGLQESDLVEVTGARDQEGTLVAATVKKTPAPPPPPPPKVRMRWGMIVLSVVLGWIVAGALAIILNVLRIHLPSVVTKAVPIVVAVFIIHLKVKDWERVHAIWAAAIALVIAILLSKL